MNRAKPLRTPQTPREAPAHDAKPDNLSVLLASLRIEQAHARRVEISSQPLSLACDRRWRVLAPIRGQLRLSADSGPTLGSLAMGSWALLTSARCAVHPDTEPGEHCEMLLIDFRCSLPDALGLPQTLPPLILSSQVRPHPIHTARTLADPCEFNTRDDRPGAQAALCALLGAMVIPLLREWVIAHQDQLTGALAASVDARLAPALQAIHDHPQRAHSIEQLAALSGLSRTVFIERFKDVLGDTPGAYARTLRLRQAADLLERSDHEIARIAGRVGYQSSGAFCTAFKAWSGHSPGQYRARHKAGLMRGTTPSSAGS